MQRSIWSNVYTVLLILSIIGIPLLLFLASDQPLFGFLSAIISFGILLSYGLYSRILARRN